MAYSGTTLNGSSVSLVHTLHSQASSDNLNTTYALPSTNPYLYKPVRPTKSRLRPALPTAFLQLPGGDRSSSPWKQHSEPRRQASYESFASNSKDQTLLKELTDNTGFVRDSSPGELATATDILFDSASNSNMNRFSTCFGGSSTASLLDPEMMQVDSEKTKNRFTQSFYPNPRSRLPTTSDNDSTDSEGLLKEWSTPRIAQAPTLRISAKELPSLPNWSKGPIHYRSASSCSLYRDESTFSTFPDDESDILHIQNPEKKASPRERQTPRPSAASVKRKNMESKAEKQAIRTAKMVEVNLKIRRDEPNAKDCNTAIDGLFGIGKEESKAQRCGYAGLGIAYDKRTWKATDDYQTLLRDTVRSSLYNLSPRSPRSMKRKFSSQGSTPHHSPSQSRSVSSPTLLTPKTAQAPTRRKGPPPPLDLTALSSYSSLAEVKTARKKFIGKLDPRKGEMTKSKQNKQELSNMERELDVGRLQEMKTPRKISLKGILRSVRSISNMRGDR